MGHLYHGYVSHNQRVFERWLNAADSTGALEFPPQFQDILRLGRRRRRWRRAQQGLLQDLRELDWKPTLR